MSNESLIDRLKRASGTAQSFIYTGDGDEVVLPLDVAIRVMGEVAENKESVTNYKADTPLQENRRAQNDRVNCPPDVPFAKDNQLASPAIPTGILNNTFNDGVALNDMRNDHPDDPHVVAGDPMVKAQPSEISDNPNFPMGAIENGRALISRLTQHFTTDDLDGLTRCFEYMVDYLLSNNKPVSIVDIQDKVKKYRDAYDAGDAAFIELLEFVLDAAGVKYVD